MVACIRCVMDAHGRLLRMFTNIDVTVFTELHSNGFIASSVCIHNILEHADDLSKLLG